MSSAGSGRPGRAGARAFRPLCDGPACGSTGPAARLVPIMFLLLAACGPSETDPGPGGVTVGEARALEEAAEMLEEQRLRPEDIAPPAETPTAEPNR